MVIRVPNLHMPQALTHSLNVHFLTRRKWFSASNACLQSLSYIRAMGPKKRFLKSKKVFKEDLKELTGRMADRNRELVPGSWSPVRERALPTGLTVEGWYSEHSGVCRRAELLGRSVKVKKVWQVDGGLMRGDLKAKQSAFSPLLSR